jgi:hypothetical protein
LSALGDNQKKSLSKVREDLVIKIGEIEEKLRSAGIEGVLIIKIMFCVCLTARDA